MAKTIIFANGQCAEPQKLSQYIEPDDIVICVNGGTRHAIAVDIKPHFIIGDLDSLPSNIHAYMRREGVEIIHFPVKKDKTDLELALEFAKKKGATEIWVLTALGGRMDQSIANILLLTRKEWQPCHIRLIEGDQQALLLHGPTEVVIEGQPGDTLSVIPLSPVIKNVDLLGLEWPVQQTEFIYGSTLPISNSFISAKALVKIGDGVALVVHAPSHS